MHKIELAADLRCPWHHMGPGWLQVYASAAQSQYGFLMSRHLPQLFQLRCPKGICKRQNTYCVKDAPGIQNI